MKRFYDPSWLAQCLSLRPGTNWRHHITRRHDSVRKPVLADSEEVEGLKQHYPRAIGIEMESFGFCASLRQLAPDTRFMMVKGLWWTYGR